MALLPWIEAKITRNGHYTSISLGGAKFNSDKLL
jgi:hypothetical protein